MPVSRKIVVYSNAENIHRYYKAINVVRKIKELDKSKGNKRKSFKHPLIKLVKVI